jgi:hypothetical protein
MLASGRKPAERHQGTAALFPAPALTPLLALPSYRAAGRRVRRASDLGPDCTREGTARGTGAAKDPGRVLAMNVLRSATALVIGITALGWSWLAAAQTVVVQPGEPPAAAPPPAPSVVVTPSVAQAQPRAPWVVVNGAATPVLPEPATPIRLVTRPNRARLMSGLIAFGQSYIASMGIAATSRHHGDSNLWIPALGPWLDLGARPGCPSFTDCGSETGLRVLLVADGILQTFGAFQIVAAFVWPETVGVPAVTTASGASLSLMPSKLGRDAYGVCALGHF